MKERSEVAWKIASLYSSVLGSETRDLATHIDEAIATERERCAKIADRFLSTGDRPFSRGQHGAAFNIALAIRGGNGQITTEERK